MEALREFDNWQIAGLPCI